MKTNEEAYNEVAEILNPAKPGSELVRARSFARAAMTSVLQRAVDREALKEALVDIDDIQRAHISKSGGESLAAARALDNFHRALGLSRTGT